MMIRTAQETDLEAMYEVYYQNEVLESPHPPARGDIPVYLRHVLKTGTLLVAEQQGTILAYAGAITRGGITFLTDLFVHPLHQSSHLGKTLLQAVLPQDGLTHCTVSSSDPRALALYVRAGMTPQWPYFGLLLEQPGSVWQTASDLDISEAKPGDLTMMQADAERSGRPRPMEQAFWVQEERALPLWFQRHGQPIGYGYIRLGAGTLWHPQACTVGPIGAGSVEEATACVLAAVTWAVQRAEVIRIGVPGPHPCLAPLLERGFRITYVDTFVSTAKMPFFDARRYIPSGGDVF